MNDELIIQTLYECIDKLMELLKETRAADKAQEIYQEFFGE